MKYILLILALLSINTYANQMCTKQGDTIYCRETDVDSDKSDTMRREGSRFQYNTDVDSGNE